jgi:hypothetical protein
MLNKDTAALLQDTYRLAHIQAVFGEQDLSLDVDWPKLRLRFEEALVREGLEIPERLELSLEKEENNV